MTKTDIMKRTKRQRWMHRARLECFEQRLCMAGDLIVLPDEIQVSVPIAIADYSDSPIVEPATETSNPEDTPSDHEIESMDLSYEDGMQDWLVGLDPWLEGIPSTGTVDTGVVDDSLTDGVIDSDEPISIPQVGHRPGSEDREPNVDPENGSAEIIEVPLAGEMVVSGPKPSPSTGGKENTTVQGAPASESKGNESQAGAFGAQQSILRVANEPKPETNASVIPSTIQTPLANGGVAPINFVPASRNELPRFSSSEIAVSVMSDRKISPTFTKDNLAILPDAPFRKSAPPQYFVSPRESPTQVARRRDSYSDQSILHRMDEIEVADAPNPKTTVAVARIPFDPEKDRKNEEQLPDTTLPWTNGLLKEPEPQPRKDRPIQRLLGFFMAGALISIQEAGRILGKQNIEEKALHPKRFSTLKNSSNS